MVEFKIVKPLLFLLFIYSSGVAQSIVEKSEFNDKEAIVLLDESEFEVINRNKSKYKRHCIIQINKEKGKKYGELTIGESNFIKIKKISAKVFDQKGETVEKLKEKDFKKSPFAGGSLYDESNYKWYNLGYTSFPYIIEYAYELEMSSLFFWPPWLPQWDVPVVKSSYKLEIDSPHNFNTYSIGDIQEPITKSLESKENYLWQADSLEPKIEEDWMPPEYEIQLGLFFATEDFELGNYKGTLTSWSEFGGWYNDLLVDRYNLENDIRETIRNLIDKDDSEVEKIKKIYSYLQQHTRYVAIYLNIGGWQPHPANSVYMNKYGDCKDLSILMISMLKEIGIQAYPAVVKTRDEGILIKEFPSNQFNHMIAFVPLTNDTMWLECTADYLSAGELPLFDEGCDVLVIKNNGGEIVRTPKSKSYENLWVSKIEGKLSLSGSFKFNGIIVTKGNYSNYLRKKLNSSEPKEQKEWLQKIIGKYAPKIIIEYFTIENLSDSFHLPLSIKFKGVIEKFAGKSASRLFINPNIIDRITSYDIPSEKERKFPVYYNNAYIDIDSLIIELPLGHEIEAKPDITDLQSEFCSFSNSYLKEENKLIYVRKFELKEQQIPTSEYPEFLEMFNFISRIDHSKIVLKK